MASEVRGLPVAFGQLGDGRGEGSERRLLRQICQPGGFLPRIDAEARQRREDGERHTNLLLTDGGEEEGVVLGVTEGIFATQCHDASSR